MQKNNEEVKNYRIYSEDYFFDYHEMNVDWSNEKMKEKNQKFNEKEEIIFPAYCCKECGEMIGYLARWLFPFMHDCKGKKIV